MLFDQFGNPIKEGLVQFVDEVMKARGATGAPWPAIELIVSFFKKQKPKRYQSHLVQVRDLRETRKDQRFASTTDKVTGGILRYTLDIPSDIIYMIRKVYSEEELPMNREFFTEFAKRYPEWKVAQKL